MSESILLLLRNEPALSNLDLIEKCVFHWNGAATLMASLN